MSPLILDIIVRDDYILGQTIYNLLLSRQQRAVCARSAGVERTERRAYRKYGSRMGGFEELYADTLDARLTKGWRPDYMTAKMLVFRKRNR